MGATAENHRDEVSVRELTHQTSKVLGRVKAGERLTITERGVPIASVIPLSQPRRQRPSVGYVSSGDPNWAASADDELAGFGE